MARMSFLSVAKMWNVFVLLTDILVQGVIPILFIYFRFIVFACGSFSYISPYQTDSCFYAYEALRSHAEYNPLTRPILRAPIDKTGV